MLKTLIVLPDGTEISSGTDGNSIQSTTVRQQVNSAKLLTLGSACTALFEAKIHTPDGNISIREGEEITVYRINADSKRHRVGMFTLQKPTKLSAATIKITAYDRITWLDKDLTAWLAGLKGWPYSLLTFADMVCEACGLTLANDSIPNGDYQIQAFTAQGITGRKLMQWVGEIAGRFCRATPEGNIEFAWYEPSGVQITPGGDRFFYQNGLTYEDYQVAAVEKVQIRLTENDVGVVWPDETGEKNTYIISGNYLLTTTTTAALVPVAQTIYEILKDVIYTPCKVTIPICQDIHAGHTVQITDRSGKTFTAYVMTKTQTGQRETLECTGSYRRDSTTVVNNQSYEALSGKILEIKQSVEGFSVTASEIKGNSIYNTVEEFYPSTSHSELVGGVWSTKQPEWTEGMYLWRRFKVTKGDGTISYTPSENGVCITGNTGATGADGKTQYLHIKYSDDGKTFTANNGEELGAWIGTLVNFTKEDSTTFSDYTWKKFTEDVDEELGNLNESIENIRESVSQMVVDDDSIRASVSNLESIVNSTTKEVLATKEQIASVNLQSNQLEVKIEKISSEGVTKVSNTTGTFNEDGLMVDRTNSPTKTQIAPDGMTVYRKTANGGQSEVLTATSDGVDATNLHAKTYLIIGGRSRFENYGTARTGCFWIGE